MNRMPQEAVEKLMEEAAAATRDAIRRAALQAPHPLDRAAISVAVASAGIGAAAAFMAHAYTTQHPEAEAPTPEDLVETVFASMRAPCVAALRGAIERDKP